MRFKTTKRLILASALIAAATWSAHAQVYTINIVGYVNLQMYAGDNLFVNQLDDGNGDALNSILTQGVLTGSTFTEWNSAAKQFLPTSIFNGTSWSINYDLSPDETGAVLNSPGNTTITLVGSVLYYDPSTLQSTFSPPARSGGTYLLGYPVPLANETFQDIIGRNPLNGESVRTLDAATQTYSVDTFENGSWNEGTPSFAVGEAAYFTLVDTPEPSTYALAGMGATLLFILRRRLDLRKI